MQIFLRYVLGGPYCLDVEPTDTIEILKNRIQAKEINLIAGKFRLKFGVNELYNNNSTLASYNIGNNSNLEIIPLMFGGAALPGIKTAKLFTDPTKIAQNKIKLTNDAPFYRIVTYGMNLFGICKNKKCQAYKKEVIHPLGYGTFDLFSEEDEKIVCPCCDIKIDVETCGFLFCKYSYSGKKCENKKEIIDVNEMSFVNEKTDLLDYFDKGNNKENQSLWIELKITANKL